MGFTVNYSGSFFCTDKEDFNSHWFASFKEANSLLHDLIECGVDENAYLEDEEYHCTLHWDKKDKEFYWDA